jgi:hypothetical protein
MDKNRIQQLKRRRRVLENKMRTSGPLMRGSVVELGTTCGNPNCRCARGEKHRKYYYSLSSKGKTKIIYLGKTREPLARQYSENYKRLLEILEEMTIINMQLLKAGALR